MPCDLSFLPATSCLRSCFFLVTSLINDGMEDVQATQRKVLLTSLISAVSTSSRHAQKSLLPSTPQPLPSADTPQPLPPADYSSLLLLAVLHWSGDSPDLALACVHVACGTREGLGVIALMASLTLPIIFSFLPVSELVTATSEA